MLNPALHDHLLSLGYSYQFVVSPGKGVIDDNGTMHDAPYTCDEYESADDYIAVFSNGQIEQCDK